jgi:hypothetical protein
MVERLKYNRFVSMKHAAIAGALTGSVVFISLISLNAMRLFSPNTNAFLEDLTFRLCPFYILGFSNEIHSMSALIVITLLTNAIIYAAAFTLIALALKGAKRMVA